MKRRPQAVMAKNVAPSQVISALALATVVLMILWGLDPLFVHTNALTSFQGHPPTAPLYAFWAPVFRLESLLFVLLCTGLVWAIPQLCQLGNMGFTTALFGVAFLLPLALFAARHETKDFGRQFLIYPQEEYQWDAQRIKDLPSFLRDYVKSVPQLSLHGRVHPPGNAVLLYVIGKPFAFAPLAIGFGILVLFAAGVAVTYCWMREVCGATEARIGTLVLVASPSVLNFACTSMDAVFFLLSGLAIWPGVIALSERGKIYHAVATGAALFLAMMFSFSAFPVGLFLASFGAVIFARRMWFATRQLALILVAFVASCVLMYGLTGFSIWENFAAARGEHAKIMTDVMQHSFTQMYWKLLYGNASAFLIGCGVAVVALFGLRLVRLLRPRAGDLRSLDPFLIATLVTLAVLFAGGIFTMETERIWLFAIPWLAAAGSKVALETNDVRWLLSTGWMQALVMATLLFTLW